MDEVFQIGDRVKLVEPFGTNMDGTYHAYAEPDMWASIGDTGTVTATDGLNAHVSWDERPERRESPDSWTAYETLWPLNMPNKFDTPAAVDMYLDGS